MHRNLVLISRVRARAHICSIVRTTHSDCLLICALASTPRVAQPCASPSCLTSPRALLRPLSLCTRKLWSFLFACLRGAALQPQPLCAPLLLELRRTCVCVCVCAAQRNATQCNASVCQCVRTAARRPLVWPAHRRSTSLAKKGFARAPLGFVQSNDATVCVTPEPANQCNSTHYVINKQNWHIPFH